MQSYKCIVVKIYLFYFKSVFFFFHSFAESVKRYFCFGWLGKSGYRRSIAPSDNAGWI